MLRVQAGRLKFLYRKNLEQLKVAALSVIVVVVVASILIFTHAAGFFAASEAESGTKTANAVAVSDTSASGGNAVKFTGAATPPPAGMPTDATTGPRIALTDRAGGTFSSGTFSGDHFTSSVTLNGPVTLTDCSITGTLNVYDGPVLMDYCDVTGKINIVTDNLDPAKKVFTTHFSKFVGPDDNDTMRIGSKSTFGDSSRYMNTLFEDSIIYSPATSFVSGQHFDLLQFGGGHNSTFTRVAFGFAATTFSSEMTNYINNGTDNTGVVVSDSWIKGGPVGYVLSGPMNVSNTVIYQSSKHYGYVYPAPGTVLTNVTDEFGNSISGT
jgi:hypothetical protein